jgi:class 3 adenylate cyclase/HAMP domain-containing protein
VRISRSPAHRSRLFRKYLTVLVVLVAGTLIASGLLEAYFSYRENEAGLVELQQSKASGAAARIQQFLTDVERQIRDGYQTAPTSPATIEHERSDLLRLLRQAPALTEASYLDSVGRERVHVSRLGLNLTAMEDYSREPKFLEAKSGQTYFSPVYFRGESEPYMTLGIADRRPDPGVTVAEANLKFIWDVVSGIKIGDAGYAYVVDPRGQLVAHPDISLVLQKTDLSGLPQVRSALEASVLAPDRGEATIAANLQGRQVLITYAEISPVGWVVLVEQPLEEVFAPLYASLARTALFLAIGLVLAVIASLLLARRMVAPIQSLQAGAALVGGGALDHRIGLKTGDELEVLSDAFDRMAARLHDSYTRLEQKVEERTRDLADALKQIDRQRAELAAWNQSLEARVATQVDELQRLGRLRRFLAPQIADLVVASGDEALLESHRREIAVVSCALRGFTAFSEAAEPEDVLGVLREFRRLMGELVFRFGGTLERFSDEGLVVFFNDPVPCPDPAARAVRMTLAMRERADEQAGSWRQRGYPLAFVGGVAIGYATLGTIGFEGRLDYAAIGGVTNQAAALCARADPGQILASQRVLSAVRDLIQAEKVGGASEEGLAAPKAYRVLGLRTQTTAEPTLAAQLTAREREVAALVARGLTNRQIAEELVISERTVAAHIEHILTKLDFASRTQVGVWAAEHGLLEPHARPST